MGQPAYDYNYNGITLGQAVRRPEPQPERRPNLRVEQGGKAAISPLRAMMQHGVQILALGLLAGRGFWQGCRWRCCSARPASWS